ncbi:MAG: hypothetical protein ICV68_02740 [Pyrinomonadaceae bacterium]|nr:hypothetical protein [Pyrinomonadaceae bacterium]
MSIANELSSDVATAVLARNETRTPIDSQQLVGILLNFHSALRALTVEERRRRLRPSIPNAGTPRSLSRLLPATDYRGRDARFY